MFGLSRLELAVLALVLVSAVFVVYSLIDRDKTNTTIDHRTVNNSKAHDAQNETPSVLRSGNGNAASTEMNGAISSESSISGDHVEDDPINSVGEQRNTDLGEDAQGIFEGDSIGYEKLLESENPENGDVGSENSSEDGSLPRVVIEPQDRDPAFSKKPPPYEMIPSPRAETPERSLSDLEISNTNVNRDAGEPSALELFNSNLPVIQPADRQRVLEAPPHEQIP